MDFTVKLFERPKNFYFPIITISHLPTVGKELIAIDGSKFKAVNSKDNNFTKGKLTDRITWIDEKIADYLSRLDENDNSETPISEMDQCQ